MSLKGRPVRFSTLPVWAELGHAWQEWFGRSWRGGVSLLLVLGSLSTALASWVILAGLSPVVATREVMWTLLACNALFMLPLIALVVYRYGVLWLAQQRGVIGAQLHNRMVGLFAVVALVPAILMGGMALVTLDRGLDSWFQERSEQLLTNTSNIANIYLTEHQDVLRRDTQAMALDVDNAWARPVRNDADLQEFLEAQTALRALHMAAVLDAQGRPLLATSLWSHEDIAPPPIAFTTARQGTPVLLTLLDIAQLRVLVWLEQAQAYLYVARPINPRALELMAGVEAVGQQYARLQGEQRDTQIAFALIYLGVGFVILLSAIWLGMFVASRLVLPIMSLMTATDKVAQGSLSERLQLISSSDEMQKLGESFNNMVARLEAQRSDIDARQYFTEMVLAGVSSGVLGLSKTNEILHANAIAARLLKRSQKQLIGQRLDKVAPRLGDVLKEAKAAPSSKSQEISLPDAHGKQRRVRVQLVQTSEAHAPARVMTLDDLTDLIATQRLAAWADIARRIAHEIKNPLTPIQLSAERLENRYGAAVQEPDVFRQCTQTIIAQVQDIGRMVDEFASFARMPKAVMRRFRAADIVNQAVFLQRVTHPEIMYEITMPDDTELIGDSRQFNQALTNVLKNAAEAIEAKSEAKTPARICVTLAMTKAQLIVSVSDTGGGFPAHQREALVEPYASTRAQGTGLGLAIAKKVTEEHGGSLTLGKARWGKAQYGAKVTMRFARKSPPKMDS